MAFRRRKRAPRPEPVEWVRVAWARHQPEAEFLLGMLRDAGIPAWYRRTGGFDVPDMLAGGPREILVPAAFALEAHALLDPAEGLPDEE